MRVAVISDIHGHTRPRGRDRRQSTARRPDECGASGTRSATARGRTSAPRWSAPGRTSRLIGNHDLGALRGLDLTAFSARRGAAARWTTGPSSARRHTVPRGARAEAKRNQGCRALPRERARAACGSTSSQRGGRTRHVRAGARRPSCSFGHSHVPLATCWLEDGERPGRGSRPPTRPPRSTRGGGSSIPARSASRATATREPRGSCSTPPGAGRRGACRVRGGADAPGMRRGRPACRHSRCGSPSGAPD